MLELHLLPLSNIKGSSETYKLLGNEVVECPHVPDKEISLERKRIVKIL